MKKKEIIRALSDIVGREHLLSSEFDLRAYAYDASLYRAMPDVVVYPATAREVAEICRWAYENEVPFLARGSGTNLSGGTVPVRGGIIIHMSRMNKILEIDTENQLAVVQPYVYNLELQDALDPLGYFYAPDPASQRISTLGGNVGENSGGPHCLKYGVTTNHVMGLEVVLPWGELKRLGPKPMGAPGYDWIGLLVGSEGTLGIVTEITVRIMKKPEAVRTFLVVYDRMDDAARTVSAIIAEGIIPATLEMMDRVIMEAVEKSQGAGYPLDAEAVLIIEIDGVESGLVRLSDRIERLCREHGAREVRLASDQAQRDALWAGRRGAFGAVGRLKPKYLVCDGTVPRTKLPEVLKKVAETARKYRLPIGNVFHAGDGNLHPLILFDDRDPKQVEAVHHAGKEILEACAALGGTISGEHGIGIEKLDSMNVVFTEETLRFMKEIKEIFDPKYLCNPGKALPLEAAAQGGP